MIRARAEEKAGKDVGDHNSFLLDIENELTECSSMLGDMVLGLFHFFSKRSY